MLRLVVLDKSLARHARLSSQQCDNLDHILTLLIALRPVTLQLSEGPQLLQDRCRQRHIGELPHRLKASRHLRRFRLITLTPERLC